MPKHDNEDLKLQIINDNLHANGDISLLTDILERGQCTRFGYLSLIDQKKKFDLTKILFWKKVFNSPFGENGASELKDIQPEVGKVYALSKGRVFALHPKLGLIKFQGIKYKRIDGQMKIFNLTPFTKKKLLIQIMDAKTLQEEKKRQRIKNGEEK